MMRFKRGGGGKKKMFKYFYIQTSYVFPDLILHSYWNTHAVDKIVLVLRGQLRQ
jgi:hypothetical protein